MTATWPASLPQYVQQQGYGEDIPDQTVESQVDSGPPQTRRRFTKNYRLMQGAIVCSAAQKTTFEAFYLDTLAAGTQSFFWVNPYTQKLALLRFRKPAPKISPFGSTDAVQIQMNLFQLAQYTDFRFDVDDITFDSTAHTFDEMNIY